MLTAASDRRVRRLVVGGAGAPFVEAGGAERHAALMARLTRGGARVLRTDQAGDVAAVVTRHGLAVAARGDPPAA